MNAIKVGQPSHILASLNEDGFVIVKGAAARSNVEALDQALADSFASTPFCRGGFYGDRTIRFGGLLARTEHAAGFVAHPLILEVARSVLGPSCDTLQLNLTQGLALHPGALPQFPHRDQDMWRGEKGSIEYLVNVMWPFTSYTAENGATLVWPRSHGRAAVEGAAESGPVVAACEPGDALVFLGSTLHGAGGNRSDGVRRGMIVSYCLGWLKPYENQWLVYPPALARRFPRSLQNLVGYVQHRPNLGNVEGQCPSLLLRDQALEGPEDALTPEQARAVAVFVSSQSATQQA